MNEIRELVLIRAIEEDVYEDVSLIDWATFIGDRCQNITRNRVKTETVCDESQ